MRPSIKKPVVLAFLLFLLWVLLTSSIQPSFIAAGVIVSALITLVTWKSIFTGSRDIHIHDAAFTFRPLRALQILPRLFFDLISASAEVSLLAVKPSLQLKPGIIRVNSHLQHKTALVVLANYITLTPGTLTVDMDLSHHHLYIHSLNLDNHYATSLKKDVTSKEKVVSGVFE